MSCCCEIQNCCLLTHFPIQPFPSALICSWLRERLLSVYPGWMLQLSCQYVTYTVYGCKSKMWHCRDCSYSQWFCFYVNYSFTKMSGVFGLTLKFHVFRFVLPINNSVCEESCGYVAASFFQQKTTLYIFAFDCKSSWIIAMTIVL